MPLRPTLPTLEPLPRSRVERVSGHGPPLMTIFQHYLRQLIPEPKFIWKWSAVGAFLCAAYVAGGTLFCSWDLDRDNQGAKARYEDRLEGRRIRAKDEADRKAVSEQFAAITARAVANWETWKSQFTSDADGIACAHGSNREKTRYEITCQIGPKGKLPTHAVVCDQNSCGFPQPPAPAAKK